MMSSKATSAVSGPASGFGRSGGGLRSSFLSAIAPSLSALLGSCAEAEPSGATSAIRYDCSECVIIVPVVVPELELIDVERQVGLADLVKIANDAPLNQRPETFDVLRVHRTDNVLVMCVADDLMRKFLIETVIADPFIANQQRHLVGHDLAHKTLEGCAINAVNDASHNLALAADRADDRDFARTDTAATGAAALADMPVLRLAADECLVNLNL